MIKGFRKLAFVFGVVHLFCNAHQRGQTVLFVQPPFQSGSPERESLIRFPPSCDQLSFFQLVPLGSWTVGSEDIPDFFTPFGMTILRVAEEHSKTRDIDAIHLNIKTVEGRFLSDLIFRARQRVAGFGMAWRQQFAKKWWFEIGTPFVRVENRFTFKELIRDKSGGAVHANGLDNAPFVSSATQGFRQPNWKYGKIDTSIELVKEGLADVELKLGYQPYASDCLRMNGYLGVLVPSGNKPTGAYVFEPIVGNGHHYGFFYGSHLGLNFWDLGIHHLSTALDFHTRYLFKGHEIRSFDLKDKEFSRYISTYRTPIQAEAAAAAEDVNSGTSGINVFTQPVKVFPGYSFTLLSALVYTNQRLMIELGYNFFAKQAERVEIDWNKTAQVKDIEGKGETNEARTINKNVPCAHVPVDEYVELLGKNIDPISAANQALIQYTFYATGGYYVWEGNCPVIVGLGLSYEITANTPYNRWGMWGKIAMQF